MSPAAAALARAERFRALLATLAAEPAAAAGGAPEKPASASAEAATIASGTALKRPVARPDPRPPAPAGHRNHAACKRWLMATSACAVVVVGGWATLGSARSPGAGLTPTLALTPATADAVAAVPAPALPVPELPVPELPVAAAPCAAAAAALGLCNHLLK